VAAAHTGASSSCHGVDLIDEDDARRMFFSFLKQVADTGSADADEHFHEIGSGNAEERHACLSCNSFRQKGFTGSGRAHKKNSFRDSRADLCIFLRCFQEIDHLNEVFFFLF
jgi:hypothetical protein